MAVGCSGGGGDPTQPGIQNPSPGLTSPGNEEDRQGEDLTDEEPGLTDNVVDPFEGITDGKNHTLWGLYHVIIDPLAETMEVIPMRASNVHLNIIKLLEPGGKYGHFQLASGFTWNVDQTELDLDMSIYHPLEGMRQFSGFDMRAIIITKGTLGGFSNPGIIMSSLDEMRLMNADGYTRWWNPTEFPGDTFFSYVDGALGFKHDVWNLTSTMNGFKYFADGLDKDAPLSDLDPSNRGLFEAGKTNLRHFKFWVPDFPSTMIFNYAIDVSWAVPNPNPPENLPDDFPIEANQSESWLVTVDEMLNELYYLEGTGESGGQLILNVNVYDWQGPLPATEPGGTVARVSGEWPGLFDGTEAIFVSDEGDHAVYQLTMVPAASAITSNDPVEYMIWVEDSDPLGYTPVMPAEALVSGCLFSAEVGDVKPNLPPQITAGIDGDASPGLTIETYTVTAIDPDGDDLTYLWTVEDTPIADDPGNGDGTIDIDWSTLGFDNYTISCNVSDSINTPVPAPILDVLVGNTDPVLGDIEGLTEVTAADTAANYSVIAYDPDVGQTLTYDWSFVPDGDPEDFSIPGDPGDGSVTLDFSTIEPGDYNINVEVFDGYVTVTGTFVFIQHSNTPPTVEDVTGLDLVLSLNTSENYQADASDPDTTQTLTFMWSVVPDGDPGDFSLPSNPDGSIDIDWSTYPVNIYSVNKQADDGMDLGTGNPLVVTKGNSAPTVGTVTGPTVVTSDDTAAPYSAEPISDIDPDQILTALWSVVPTGIPPIYTIPSEPDLSLLQDWLLYPDDDYDVNCQVNDGFVSVEGTYLSVTKYDNQSPEAGPISGPTHVTHSDTASDYTCSMIDPEGDPLTVFWSVVPFGDMHNYVIPGVEGDPLTVDWSTHPALGDYEINIQLDDGNNPPVEGIPWVVSLENTAPTIHSCDGLRIVNSNSTSAHYSVDYSDIDTLQTHTINWSFRPDGTPPIFDVPANPDGSVDYDWSSHQLGDYDVYVEVDDGFVSVTCGPIDVTKVNIPPDVGPISGKLTVNGSDDDTHYTCAITDPDTFQTLTILWSVVPNGDPANYIIPDLGDGDVSIDWSGYDIGHYDVNVRVTDGVDITEGLSIVVDRENTIPTVGNVDGPSAVDCTDTSAHYTAPVEDLDTTQILTVTWSIVPTGDPENFIIPSNLDYSIDINWSAYPVGDYDVNLEATDGLIAVQGTKLTVQRLNTPPEVGSVNGLTITSVSEINNYYLDPPTYDCDPGQTLDYAWSVVPFGDPPSYTIFTPVENVDIDWSGYGTGLWTISAQVDDGYGPVDAASSLDVAVALCANTDAHTYAGTLTPSGYSIAGMSVLPRADIAFVEGGVPGIIQGKALVQIDERHLGLFDADSNIPPIVPLSNIYDLQKDDTVLSLDADPSSEGRMLLVTQQDPHLIKVLASNTLTGNPFIDFLDSGNPVVTWTAIDVMSNGDFWAVYRENIIGIPDFYLMKFTYQPYSIPGDPTYLPESGSITPISLVVGSEDDIFDIAINNASEKLYIFEAGLTMDGDIHVYSIPPGGPAVFESSFGGGIYSQPIDYSIPGLTGFAGFAMWGDIDIDHVDGADEVCRMLVYARLADMTAELVRFDETLTELDREAFMEPSPAFAINVDPDPWTRNLLMPLTFTLQWWETPGAW